MFVYVAPGILQCCQYAIAIGMLYYLDREYFLLRWLLFVRSIFVMVQLNARLYDYEYCRFSQHTQYTNIAFDTKYSAAIARIPYCTTEEIISAEHIIHIPETAHM